MTNPQQPELRRSGRGGTDPDHEPGPQERAPAEEGSAGPVPPENQPGHRPEHDQDKPEGPPRRRRR